MAASVVTAVLVAGLGSRLAMFAVRLLNPSHNGEVTHANAVVGQWTAGGTGRLVLEAMFLAPPMWIAYLLARPVLPTRRGHRVLAAAAFGLVVGFPMTIDPSNYEFHRYTSPAVAVGLFVVLLPIGGGLLAALTEWWSGGGRPSRPHPLALDIVWTAAIVALTSLALVIDVRAIVELVT